MNSGASRLALPVALAYTLVIGYASLHPFEGWRTPPHEVLAYLTAPWPRYIVAGDILLNIVAYFPLGALFYVALRPPLAPAAAFATATLLAMLLSLALESAQMFLPTRIASNLDVLTNTAGAALGAVGAHVFSLPFLPLRALRERAVRPGTLGDYGIILIALWIVIQFHPAPLALSSGDWRELLHLSPHFAHTPGSYLVAEAAIVALGIAAVGLLVALVLRPQEALPTVIALVLLLTLIAKSTASATLARPGLWWQWVTPGAVLGLACGIVLLAATLKLSDLPRAAAAVLCIAAGVALVNVTPQNPYYAAPVFMLNPQATHLGNFSHIVRALSITWPLLAIAYIALLTKIDVRARRWTLSEN